ncbi:MAG: hypothetical protein V4538_15275 [Bacteroidota bacterium]
MPWIIPLATAGYSIYNSAHNANKAKKSENALEDSLNNTPKYKPNQSILDYYDKALNKYNTNPTDTMEYKATSQGIKQGTVSGLRALQDRRSGLAGIPTLMANQNNSLLKAAVTAEQRKAQQLGVLGEATRLKAGEQGKEFQQNEIYPFEAKYNLLSLKAAGERAIQRQSTQNAYNNAWAAGSIFQDNWDNGKNIWGTKNRKTK